jgi:hypothetical protein
MNLANKVSELLEQIDLENLDDLTWRGTLDNGEWKILLHKEQSGEKYNIIIKKRDRVE